MRIPFANLRAWCEFWVDSATTLTCCQTADQELLEVDGELFDCETCPFLCAASNLWPENVRAWDIFRTLASRLQVDWHLGSEMLRRLTDDYTASEYKDLMERVTVIYDIVYPPAKEQS